MGLMSWFFTGWHARQREIDIEVLWPSLCDRAHSIEVARAAFRLHASRDNAWTSMSDELREKLIDSLQQPGAYDGP